MSIHDQLARMTPTPVTRSALDGISATELLDAVALAIYEVKAGEGFDRRDLTRDERAAAIQAARIVALRWDRERAALVAENERLRRDAAVRAFAWLAANPAYGLVHSSHYDDEKMEWWVEHTAAENVYTRGDTPLDAVTAALTAADAATGARGMEAEAT